MNFKGAILVLAVLISMNHFTGCKGTGKILDIIEYKRKVRGAVKQYQSPDWEKRLGAVETVNEYLDSVSESQLLKELLDSKDDILILAENQLLVATHDVHGAIRIEALYGLGVINSGRGKKRIQELADSSDEDHNVRWAALMVLGDYNDPESRDIFIRGLGHYDWLIREASIKGIVRIENGDDEWKIPYIVRAASDPVESVRIAALSENEIRDQRIYRVIKKRFNAEERPTSEELKALLQAVKGYRLDDTTRTEVIKLLTHPRKDIRVLALRVLKMDQQMMEMEDDETVVE